MQLSIKATKLELTEDIKDYVLKKMDKLPKYFADILEVRVEVGLTTDHHRKGKIYFCEANVSVPGKLLRVRKETESLMKAIDKTKDHLKVVLKRHKEKAQEK